MKTSRKKRGAKSAAQAAPLTGNAAPSGGITPGQRWDAYMAYRDYLNPVAGLTMRRARSLIEAYPQGNFADLMWTFGAPFVGIDCADADMLALIECRTAPLLEMDWEPKIVTRDGIDTKLAEEQQAFVRELMDGIGNLYEAIEHFELAPFRGFAHAEIIENADGDPTELRVVDQWNIVRNGSRGAWKYNPNALETNFHALSNDLLIDPAHFVIREVKRPIGRIALVKFIRENLSQKDWDAFIEIYGIPGGVVIGPPNVPTGKEGDYENAAKKTALGGSGYLPNGSEYHPNDGPRGTNPFKEHLAWLSQKLVLAGTGGKLTMLTEAGSGTLAGNAHADTFDRICRAEARRISEMLQEQLVADRLDAKFPGQDHLAYFELSFREEVDSGQIVEEVCKLAVAGFRVSAKQVAEKTGYEIDETVEPVPPPKPGAEPAPAPVLTAAQKKAGALLNRASAKAAAHLGVSSAWVDPVAEVFVGLEQLGGTGDQIPLDQVVAALQQAGDRVPELFDGMDLGDFTDVLEAVLGGAALQGAREAIKTQMETAK